MHSRAHSHSYFSFLFSHSYSFLFLCVCCSLSYCLFFCLLTAWKIKRKKKLEKFFFAIAFVLWKVHLHLTICLPEWGEENGNKKKWWGWGNIHINLNQVVRIYGRWSCVWQLDIKPAVGDGKFYCGRNTGLCARIQWCASSWLVFSFLAHFGREADRSRLRVTAAHLLLCLL